MFKSIIISIVIEFYFSLISCAQVKFQFAYDFKNKEFKQKVENNISALLTELTKTSNNNDTIRLSGVNISKEASRRLKYLCKNYTIHCLFKFNVQGYLHDINGYQVRQIPVIVTPVGNDNEKKNKSLVISFDKKGTITGVRIGIEDNLTIDVFSTISSTSDLKRIRFMLKTIEDYCSYYMEKNLDALKNDFSNDLFCVYNDNGKPIEKSELCRYVLLNNHKDSIAFKPKRYINIIRKMFCDNDIFNINISNIELTRHSANPNYYALWFNIDIVSNKTTQQTVDGLVFILWNFEDEDHPVTPIKIWVQKGKIQENNDYFLDIYL